MGNCKENQLYERVHKHNKYWLTWLRQVELTFWVHLNGDGDEICSQRILHNHTYAWCEGRERMSNTNTQSMSSSFHFYHIISCPDTGTLEPSSQPMKLKCCWREISNSDTFDTNDCITYKRLNGINDYHKRVVVIWKFHEQLNWMIEINKIILISRAKLSIYVEKCFYINKKTDYSHLYTICL